LVLLRQSSGLLSVCATVPRWLATGHPNSAVERRHRPVGLSCDRSILAHHTCPLQGVPLMLPHEQDGRSWWAHTTAAGWCTGKEPVPPGPPQGLGAVCVMTLATPIP